MKIRLPIDIKSLYFNIKNDNETGHTPTVATPLFQYGTYHTHLRPILDIPEIENSLDKEEIASALLSKSRVKAKINRIYLFDKIKVNGIDVKTEGAFCIYIREETDKGNVHYGRQKIHYPTTFTFSNGEVNIDNRNICKAISSTLHDYAFIVEAFEYDDVTRSLNFDAVIVGYNGIPYSKVFVNRKGVGNKFASVFNEDADIYDSEIIALRDKFGYDKVGPDNFSEIMAQNKEVALNRAYEHLNQEKATGIRRLIDDYPYALFDFEYYVGEHKKYAIVRFTATKKKYFYLPIEKIQFSNDFCNDTIIILVTDINGKKQVSIYDMDNLKQMSKRINSISYEDTED